MNNIWQLQEAKSKFSELVDRTLTQGLQIVTRRGVKTVVVLPYDLYEKMIRPSEKLSDFLMRSPIAGSELVIERDQSLPRVLEIEE